jgi:outer membrane protein TolC
MVNHSILLSIVSILLLPPPAEPGITLREAATRAVERNRVLAAQRLNEESSAVRKAEVEARRAFTISLGGSAGVASDSPHITAGDMPWIMERLDEAVSSSFHLLSTPRTMYDLRIDLRQPVLTGGTLRRGIEAEARGGGAEAEMTRIMEEKLAADVEASFFRSRALQARRDSAGLLIEGLSAHLEKVERIVEAELARRSDLLETRMKIEEARLAALDVDLAVAEEKAVFAALCGLDPDEVEDPPREPPPSLEEAIAAFASSHPYFRYIEQKIAQAEAAGLVAAGRGGFQLSAFAQAHLGRPGIALFDSRPQFFVLGGLNVVLPLLDARERQTGIALAAIERRKLENGREAFAQDGERDLRRAYAAESALEAKAAAASRLAALAEEDVRLKTRLFEEGQIANLDCLAAMSQLERSRALVREIGWQIAAVESRIRALIGAQTEEP